MKFPEPVISLAIEPKTKADQDKLGQRLGKLQAEDPTFRVRTDADTGQIDHRRHGRATPRDDRRPHEARVQRRGQRGPPAGRLPETITQPAQAEGSYIRQTGGHGQYGHVKIRIAPREAGKGFEFTNEIVGGAIPRDSSSRSRRGSARPSHTGVLAGYPVVDV